MADGGIREVTLKVSEGHKDECDLVTIDHDLAFLAEVDGDASADVGLDLPLAPFGPVGMAHDGAGGQDGVQIGHGALGAGAAVRIMKVRADITALVGSRICHDLVSPLGAIGNGVELLELSGAAPSEEMSLITESVANANARLRFFRVAYGSADPAQRLSRSEITATLSAAARGGRLSYFWTPEGDHPRGDVRAVFLMLQCLESAMPYGGEIHVRHDAGTWEMTGEGDRMKIDEDLWSALVTPRARINVDAARVQFALLPDALADLGRTLAIRIAPDRIVARF